MIGLARLQNDQATLPEKNGRLSFTDNRPTESGRLDSNQRPLGPEPSTLAKLSYAPISPVS
jgi:hypothetical protein